MRRHAALENAREQAGIHFTDDETGEIGVRLQIGKRGTKRSLINSRFRAMEEHCGG